MRKKLTITVDEHVHDGLHKVIGRRKISRFIETLVRPHVLPQDLMTANRSMAADEARESEAHAWAEATAPDLQRVDQAILVRLGIAGPERA